MLSKTHKTTQESQSVKVVWSAPDDSGRVVTMTTSYSRDSKAFTTSILPAVISRNGVFETWRPTVSLMAAKEANRLVVPRFAKSALKKVADDAYEALPDLIEADPTLRVWFEEISAWTPAPAAAAQTS